MKPGPIGDERFYVEADANGEEAIWRVGDTPNDKAVLWRSDVKDADLWELIVAAVYR